MNIQLKACCRSPAFLKIAINYANLKSGNKNEKFFNDTEATGPNRN